MTKFWSTVLVNKIANEAKILILANISLTSFLIVLLMLTETKGLLYVGGFDRPLDQMKVTKDLHQYNNKIVECSWDVEKKGWKFMRERTDKSFPNAYSTAIAVVESIKNPVTEKILLDFLYKYCWRPQPKTSTTMGPPAPK
ncbi:RNGTT [Bugula neritina]|uniref:RNGTT n=1 Tax=Bugula neritina TaxID=10212 RepID=A0A7J7KD99_BUGNE|nr:RNGTT [Bugula neritina]